MWGKNNAKKGTKRFFFNAMVTQIGFNILVDTSKHKSIFTVVGHGDLLEII